MLGVDAADGVLVEIGHRGGLLVRPPGPGGCFFQPGMLVEAAGIEPASESESFETPTCVVDLLCCRLVHTGSDRQDPDRTSPEGLAGGAGTGAADQPAEMSSRPAAQAPPAPTGYPIAQAANAYELSSAFERVPED